MKSNQQLWFSAMPLACLTAVGMLATDLYLPAVPQLPNLLNGTITQAQASLASFMGTLAISQIAWGWAADRYGERRTLNLGVFLLLSASIFCTFSPNLDFLILGRALQGLGAGAATAVVPALLKKMFSAADAVRSIAIVGIAESLVPALGPIAGAVLISFLPWQSTFWAIALLTAVLIPLILRLTNTLAAPTGTKETIFASLRVLLRNSKFLRSSLSYAIMFSALIMFVSSAPQLIANTFQLYVGYFSVLQVLGVAAFIAAASQSGRWVERFGTKQILLSGAACQLFACLVFLGLALLPQPPFTLVVAAWCLFCCGHGLRGPSLFSLSLTHGGAQTGQASGLLMFFSFGFSSLMTALVAPFLVLGLLPLVTCLFMLIVISVTLSRQEE